MKILGFEIKRITVSNNPGIEFTENTWVNGISGVKSIIRGGYDANTTVFSMVDTMQKKFASIPWLMYKVKSAKEANKYKTLTEEYSPSALFQRMRLKASAFDEIDDHKALKLFNKPNSYQSGQAFREQLLMFLKLGGAAPMWADMGATKREPLALHSLPTQFIRLTPTEDLNTFAKAYYTIKGEPIEIPVEQFLYWKYPNPNYTSSGSHIYGMPPLKAAANVLASDNELVESAAFTFKNKGATGVFTPKDKDGMIAAAAQSDKLRKAIDEKTNGREYGKSRTIINFPLDYHNYGFTAVEMETIAMAGQNKENLANVFNYPVYLLQMAKGTDSKYTEAIKYLVTSTIYSDLTSMRAWLNDWYLGLFGFKNGEYYFDFDITALPELQEDMQKLVSSLKEMYWVTPNEKRAVSKYDALDDPLMNKILVPSNLVPLESIFDAGMDISPDLL